MERMNKGDLLHTGTTYLEVHTFKGKDYITVKDFSTTTNALSKEVLELEEENKKLKYVIDTLMEKTCIDHITLASGEVFLNPSKRLKFNTDFMEEDTLQELRDLREI